MLLLLVLLHPLSCRVSLYVLKNFSKHLQASSMKERVWSLVDFRHIYITDSELWMKRMSQWKTFMRQSPALLHMCSSTDRKSVDEENCGVFDKTVEVLWHNDLSILWRKEGSTVSVKLREELMFDIVLKINSRKSSDGKRKKVYIIYGPVYWGTISSARSSSVFPCIKCFEVSWQGW